MNGCGLSGVASRAIQALSLRMCFRCSSSTMRSFRQHFSAVRVPGSCTGIAQADAYAKRVGAEGCISLPVS